MSKGPVVSNLEWPGDEKLQLGLVSGPTPPAALVPPHTSGVLNSEMGAGSILRLGTGETVARCQPALTGKLKNWAAEVGLVLGEAKPPLPPPPGSLYNSFCPSALDLGGVMGGLRQPVRIGCGVTILDSRVRPLPRRSGWVGSFRGPCMH